MLPIAGNGAFRQVSLRHTPCLKGDADSFAALEYSFENKTREPVEATFSFNAFNLIATNWKTARVSKSGNSLLFSQPPTTDAAWEEGYFSATLLDGDAAINPCWHRGEDLVSGPWNSKDHWYSYASKEDRELLDKEGPKYQYGNSCLSDGVLGAWLAELAGLGDGMDSKQIRSHLNAVYKHNFKQTLTSHANPQRPHYALGQEGGLLLCSWPNHDETSLPFVYSDEVWTGIEYQVASHLIQKGCLKKV